MISMRKEPIVKTFKKLLFGHLAVLIGLANGYGQQLAFPGAQGFGQYATGGRSGTVYHVTSLADDGSAGTFREAVSQPNRIIVFDVGGYINLGSAVSASSDLTIAGQTAPGGGIGLMGAELSFYGQNNIICRHLRVRQGGSSTSQSGINIGSASGGAGNMIFDHTSVEFGQWDSIDAVNTTNFTVQYCIIADPINQQFGAHVQGSNASYVNNLWVNAHNRQPLAKASTVYVNNVIYDFQAGYTVADTAGDFSHDIINNYFIAGPSTTNPNDDFFQFDSGQSVYASGNLLDSSRNGTLSGSSTAPGGVTVLNSPWSPVTVTIPTASTLSAYRIDVSSSGAQPSDSLDQQVISQVTSLGAAGGIIGSPTDTGLGNSGYGTIDGGTALTETDGDGIPDIWKNAVGLPLNTNEAMTIAANGYANIENYLNWMAGPHAFVQTNATAIDLWPYTLGFTNASPAYTFFNTTNCTVTLTNSHFAFFKPAPGFTGLASFNFVVTGSDGSAMTNTMGLLVSVVYIPKNLVWRGNGINNVWDITNTVDWFNGNDLAGFNQSDNVTFDNTGSDTPAINITNTVMPGSVVINASQNYTFGGAGVIAGTGSLTVSGTNTVIIDTTNTYTGGTTINNATVQLNNSSGLGTGLITFNGGTINQTSTIGIDNTISNLATGTLNFNNNSTIYATLTVVGGGTLNVNSTGGGVFTPGGSMSGFAGNVNVNCDMRTSTTEAANTFGSANATWNFGTTGGVYTKYGYQTATFGALAGGAGSSLGGGNSSGSSGTTYVVGGLNTSTTFGGLIANGITNVPTSLVKVGTGTLTLSGNSTHSGATTVSNGTLLVTGNLSNSPVTAMSGATLQGTGFFGGGVTIQTGGIISPGLGAGSSGTMTISNNVTLAGSATLDFDLSSSSVSANDMIAMQGGLLTMGNPQIYNFNLVNNALGAGTYVLIGGATNYSGASVSFADNLPASTRQTFAMQRPSNGNGTNGYVWLAVSGPPAATLVWQGTNGSAWDLSTTTNWLNGSAADKFYNLDSVTFNDTSTNGTVTVTPLGGAVQPAFITVSNNALAYTINGGSIMGLTTLIKNGPGTLTVSPYVFSASSYITNGSTNVIVSGTNGIAAGLNVSGTGISAGTTVESVVNSNLVELSLGATATGTNTLSYYADNSFFGGTIVNGGTLEFENNYYAGGVGPVTLNGGTLYLNNVGTGTTITCAGTNTLQTYGQPYSGFNLLGSGWLNLNIGGGGVFSPYGDWSGFSGTLYFTTGNWIRELNTATFGSSNAVWNFGSAGGLYNKYGGATIYLGALFGGSAVGLGGANNSNTNYNSPTTFVIGGINTNSIFNGTVSDGAGVSTSLIFAGPGSLTLTGNDPFSGGTTVNAGTLFVNNTAGSGTGLGVVSVNPGATLGGTGTIGGQVSFAAGATLAPGSSGPGTLTMTNDLGLNNASVLQFQLGANSDRVSVTGDLTLGGTLNISNSGGFGPGTYTLFNYGGALSVGTLTLGTTPADYTYTIDTSVQGQVNLIASLPRIGNILATPNGLVMSGSGGVTNGSYYLLTSTNIAKPLSNWTRLLTNQFDDNGNFNFTNAIGTNAQSFYRLQVP